MVFAASRGIGLLKPKLNVIAAIPCSENLPSGSSIRPGDVLHHRGGKTSEVLNTDAEGRLILADALAYLVEKKPVAVIDCATLTGAAVVALGEGISAVMGNDPELIRQVLDAAHETGEPAWELPLWQPYRKLIDSTLADVKNTGPRFAGSITAGLFLREFVGDTPWVHMDVAGTAYSDNGPGDYWPKGATGVPTRTLIQFALDRAGQGRRTPRASGNGQRTGAKKSTARRSTGRTTAKHDAQVGLATEGSPSTRRPGLVPGLRHVRWARPCESSWCNPSEAFVPTATSTSRKSVRSSGKRSSNTARTRS